MITKTLLPFYADLDFLEALIWFWNWSCRIQSISKRWIFLECLYFFVYERKFITVFGFNGHKSQVWTF